MFIKTVITKILSKTKRTYKYQNIDSNFKFGKEKTGTEWIVTFETNNGKTYYYNFRDGRKANTFYEGKEIWGMEGSGNPIRFEYWWWSKEEFERRIKNSIKREEESIESAKKKIPFLQALLS